MTGRLLRYGERAVLVELPSLTDVLALHRRLWASGSTPGLLDAVTGARTLLLVAESRSALAGVRSRALDALVTLGPETASGAHDEAEAHDPAGAAGGTHGGGSAAAAAAVVEIPVHYEGPDLAEVAERCGLSPDEVVTAHTGRAWLVGFCGFAPGFAYLVDGDPRLHVPRRDTPRTRVPAGSVGLAGEFSGIYPRASPGGWQLIGHTEHLLWDLDRDPPALLRPGLSVRFVDAGDPT